MSAGRAVTQRGLWEGPLAQEGSAAQFRTLKFEVPIRCSIGNVEYGVG